MTVIEQIDQRYDRLTKNQRKVADYLKGNLVNAAFMTITELSSHTGISASTITRFVKALGYTSYSDFQNSVQDIARQEITPVKEFRFWVS